MIPKRLNRLFSGSLSLLLIVAMMLSGCKKTTNTVPVVSTDPLTEVTTTTAKGGGLVISDGGSTIAARGICFSVQPLPTVSDGVAAAGSGAGSFTATLTGLSPNTRYHVRAFATNEVGTGYSDQLILQTMYGTVTDIDGHVYQTVKIGDQEWMAENLKVTHYRNGSVIPNKPDYAQWAQLMNGALAWYGNDYEFYGKYYGALYNYFAISDSAGICPEGWHIPDIAEWDTLFNALGGDLVAGGKLKSALTNLYQQPYWLAPNYYGTNESGFSAFPGGFRSYIEGVYSDLGFRGYWWSSTPDSIFIRGVWLSSLSGEVFREAFNKRSGASVRCVKD